MEQTDVTLIFPHQLFKEHPAVHISRPVFLIEEYLYFRQYNFNKKKLVLHRASMKFYADYLNNKGITVNYIGTNNEHSDVRKLISHIDDHGVKTIHYADVADNWLNKWLHSACEKSGIELKKYNTPNFLNTNDDVNEFFEEKKYYFQTDFYTWQRKKRNILMDGDDKPIGGKWSYDHENRLKFPKNEIIPLLQVPSENEYIVEAQKYVEQYFPGNYGCKTSPFGNLGGFYPVTFIEAERWLDDFLLHRFANFGKYEDAMVANESFLYHSVLTPMLNIGLLNPQQIINNALQTAAEQQAPLNSIEGFVRQIMGWREFIHIVYEREGSKQRTKNYWGFTRKIPKSFWNGTTGIHPVDVVIKKVLATGYTHHIERLMVMGNFMLLCEFDPGDVYQWFMEMYVDAYDWVMVPNVYGMTQFADGGLMTTKPYISGSNYLLKMGDWKNGPWQEIWDGLFWRFLHTHRNFFLQNPRLGMLVGTFDKMPEEKRLLHLKNAETFLKKLDNETD